MGRSKGESLTVLGLFAGIGGIELGLKRAGHRTQMLCEIDPAARKVLNRGFGVHVHPDIREFGSLPKVDLIAAGFPCQDLSQAGRTAGIAGEHSRLVSELFTRLRNRKSGPRWLLFENVPFMLRLQRGRAMRYLVEQLEALGFMWAYRVVDALSFGIPQRRQRVVLVASRTEDPRIVLFGTDAGECLPTFSRELLCGFYWTEGLRGLGWTVDAVPTLKVGSSIGIPSPPGIWDPQNGSIATPDIRDAERLQGFEAGWTRPALKVEGVRMGHRWKLVGNAVSVPMAEWVGRQLSRPIGQPVEGRRLDRLAPWPRAAWGRHGTASSVEVSTWPVRTTVHSLRDFLRFPCEPLSYRAAAGFYSRTVVSGLRFEKGFLQDVRTHVGRMASSVADSNASTLVKEHFARA